MRMRSKRFILGFLLAALVAVALLYYFSANHSEVDYTAAEFFERYQDWKGAEDRYQGGPFTIRGKVMSVDKTFWHQQSVTLGSDKGQVLFLFSQDNAYQTHLLMHGQEVVIRGNCI